MKTQAIALALLSLPFTVFAGGETSVGNGGLIDEIRKAEEMDRRVLTEGDMLLLTFANAKDLKEKILLPLMRGLSKSNDDKIDPNVKATIAKMTRDLSLLENDVTYTTIMPGTCNDGRDMCTGDSVYSPIRVNVKQLSAKQPGMTLAEFTGLIAHEFSHHLAGQDDHPQYRFARYAANLVARGAYGQRIFGLKDGELLIVDYWDRSSHMLATRSFRENTDPQIAADCFCEEQGHLRAHAYKLDPHPHQLAIDVGAVTKYETMRNYRYFEFKKSAVKISRSVFEVQAKEDAPLGALLGAFTEITCTMVP